MALEWEIRLEGLRKNFAALFVAEIPSRPSSYR
jgi:hypothetical protein